jgi:cytosine/creatinine deaminase
MGTGFAAIPEAATLILGNATLPAVLLDTIPGPPDEDGLVRADIVVNGGTVERIAPPGTEQDLPRLDLAGAMVWPAFVDMHTHIDKGHIWPRQPNPDGTFLGALEAVAADREARWSAEDVSRRMDFSLRCAYAHGTSLLRTHLDSASPQHRISWPVFAEMRDRWTGRVDLQAVSIIELDALLDDAYADELVPLIRECGGVLGAVPFMSENLDRGLEKVMHMAAEAGLDLDFHIDETLDPDASALRHVADTAIRTAFPGRIVAGHCCSLSTQPAAEAGETMDRVAEAKVAVVSLPMCNLYLQDRVVGRTPRFRGVTLLHELMARDIDVAVGSDNTRDPFYAYGDLDMLEVFRESVRIVQLDHPIAAWANIVARTPASILRREDHGVIGAGRRADLVLFRARTWTELLSRPQADRTVLRSGKAIDTTLPDYRELDELMGYRE